MKNVGCVIAVLTAAILAISFYPVNKLDSAVKHGDLAMERSVLQVETSRQVREGGGFLVRRPIGDKLDKSVCDPFLLLDHLGPVDYGPGEAVGAPDHPHRGFETVTYIIDGGFTHKDSVGNTGNLLPGWVQWMTAGRGVVHSEMPTKELLEKGGRFEGFQLWVNLAKKDKMVAPRYQDTAPEKIPVVKSPDGKTTVKVIAGESLGTKAFIETRSPIYFLDIHVSPGATFTQQVPNEYNCLVYSWRGAGFVGDNPLKIGQLAVLSKNGDQITIKGTDVDSIDVLLMAGIPLNEPIAHRGPFVMNSWEEIDEAIRDYRNGKLAGTIEGAEERYEETRNAVEKQKKTGTWNKS